VRTISREVAETLSLASPLTPQRLHAELLATSALGARAYLHGAAHDATVSRRHNTVRFGQSDVRWLNILGILTEKLGLRSWIYREGKTRNLWILETSAKHWRTRTTALQPKHARPTSAGISTQRADVRDPNARFYLQFVQKNYADINELHSLLAREGIDCGQIHNPSRRKDPDLWRFYVAARHHLTFAMRIGSWHPRKRGLLDAKFALRNEDEDIVRAPWRHGG
jgi:hypothetical protein